MIRAKQARALALLGALAILMTACSTTGAPSGGGQVADVGKPFVFASTQFTPVIEQENMRKKILADYKGAAVDFITDPEAVILDRISAEAKAGGQGQNRGVGLQNGQFSSPSPPRAFADLRQLG